MRLCCWTGKGEISESPSEEKMQEWRNEIHLKHIVMLINKLRAAWHKTNEVCAISFQRVYR